MNLQALFSPPTLTAERVTLRPLTLEDADALFDIFSRPEVMRYWSSPPYTSRDQAIKLVEAVQSGYDAQDFLQLGTELSHTRILIGTCTMYAFQQQCARAEIGYALHPDYWGKGLMQEALRAVIAHAFGPTNLLRLEADIEPNNHGSAKVLTSLGFEKEGYFRSRWIVDGVVSDSEMYGLVNPRFRL